MIEYGKYTYDGTPGGFLTVAVNCFRRHISPRVIISDFMIPPQLENQYEYVRTNYKDADHLFSVIGQVATVEAQQTVSDFFLTCCHDREMVLFTYIYKALMMGVAIAENYSDDTVVIVRKAILELYREAQSGLPRLDFVGFPRPAPNSPAPRSLHTSSVSNYASEKVAGWNNSVGRENKPGREASCPLSCAVVTPHNRVLPLIRGSVLKRRELDDFLLYDARHCMLLRRVGEYDDLIDVRRLVSSPIRDAADVYDKLWPCIKGQNYQVDMSARRLTSCSMDRLWGIAQ